ncbi:hypothetical protein D3875_08870 [Deinococcus cavernae]|uniref:Uncharacterized protein n=1 Tax=Deinococcus cavernae TaxID=2320857 RepID=A0A418V6D9_9DEIO|nr:hypothetical protein [Deinococcus cavernae]RJF71664.1 hypothetical protein D3875_08870 [Deinococcus cavernae]
MRTAPCPAACPAAAHPVTAHPAAASSAVYRAARLLPLLAALAALVQAQGTFPFDPLQPGNTPLTPLVQPDITVRPLIPGLVSLRRPSTGGPVTFNLNASTYPPAQFPARYPSAPQPFNVFSSASTPWSVQMEVRSQPGQGGRMLPPRALLYRVNGGPWLPVAEVPQVILSSVGPTPGWLPMTVEFQLELQGGEVGGEYGFEVLFTATALP